MTRYLILVKHSLPQIEEDKPAHEWQLSEEGKLRCRGLAQRLGQYQPGVILCSLEPKARETAEIVARELRLGFDTLENLHEHDRSGSPFLPGHQFHDAVREFFRKPNELVFGNETANQAHERFSIAVNAVLAADKSSRIVLVTHGTVISLFVSRLTGISDVLLWHELGLPSFVVLDMEAKAVVAKENVF